ncbi:hypothetical protein GGR57DRAFT_268622 [Xylariaceae sp. FL1272]|nr:hypothetical protein GGR57DRAFT_268622 [Xylariaceae sp. FL1272]
MRTILALSVLPMMANSIALAPALCLSGPVLSLHAGVSVVSVVVESEKIQQCIATTEFASIDFLPVTYSFTNFSCPGSHVASFVLPEDVPNGEAIITWRCAGLTPRCDYVNITGGRQRAPIDTQHTGTVGCVLEVVQTGTTLVTMAGPSSTEVRTLPTTLTTLTTSVLAVPTNTNANSIDTSCSRTGTHLSTASDDPRARTETTHKAGGRPMA